MGRTCNSTEGAQQQKDEQELEENPDSVPYAQLLFRTVDWSWHPWKSGRYIAPYGCRKDLLPHGSHYSHCIALPETQFVQCS